MEQKLCLREVPPLETWRSYGVCIQSTSSRKPAAILEIGMVGGVRLVGCRSCLECRNACMRQCPSARAGNREDGKASKTDQDGGD